MTSDLFEQTTYMKVRHMAYFAKPILEILFLPSLLMTYHLTTQVIPN